MEEALNSAIVSLSTFVDWDGSVPRTTCDRVELEILLEGLSLAWAEIESLLFVMEREEVEGRYAENRESEGDGRKANSASVLAAGEWSSHDQSTEQVV